MLTQAESRPLPARPMASRPAPHAYAPREPHQTVLYGLVQEHLATFVAHAARTYAAPLPKYVVAAFEGYLACGDLARGFVRCHCDGCGHDVLVAFSCKHRGPCEPRPGPSFAVARSAPRKGDCAQCRMIHRWPRSSMRGARTRST
ncbi:transposase zinc-binding domain-containing protein [Sorangium sp. So ce1128]